MRRESFESFVLGATNKMRISSACPLVGSDLERDTGDSAPLASGAWLLMETDSGAYVNPKNGV